MRFIIPLLLLSILFSCHANSDNEKIKNSLINFHISKLKKTDSSLFFSLNKSKSYMLKDEDKEDFIFTPNLPVVMSKDVWNQNYFKNKLNDISWYFNTKNKDSLKNEWIKKYKMFSCVIFSEVYFNSKTKVYTFSQNRISPFITCGPNDKNYKYQLINNQWTALKN